MITLLKRAARLLTISALAVLATDQAQAGMAVSGAVAAPSGLIEFCQRVPAECADARSYSAFAGETAPTGSVRRGPGGDLAARSHDLASFVAALPSNRAVVLDHARWQELSLVNQAINATITATSDDDAFGRAEHWTLPISLEGRAAGDCEDFALEKRRFLLARGWPADTVLLATAIAPGFGRHAVLIVRTDRGDLVLDNLTDEIRDWTATGYRWQSRQSGASLLEWVSVR